MYMIPDKNYLNYKKTAPLLNNIYVDHVVYWLITIMKYKIEQSYDKMSSYFYFYLFTDHLHLDEHNVTLIL
jgi:hypothetical protein